MFRAVSKGSKGWKAILATISTMCDETTLTISHTGISFKAMAITSVAFIDFQWSSENFSEYKCENEVKIGVRLEEFTKIIKRAEKDEDVTIEPNKKGGSLVITFGNKTYEMRLVNVDDEQRDKPRFDILANFTIKPDELVKVMGDLAIIDNFVVIKAETGKVVLYTRGDDHSVTAVVENPDLVVEQPQETRYDITYINPIISSVKDVVETISIGFSDKKPMKLSMGVSGMGQIDYYLAPAL